MIGKEVYCVAKASADRTVPEIWDGPRGNRTVAPSGVDLSAGGLRVAPFIWIGLGLRQEAAAGRAQAVAGDEACSAAPLLLLCREVDDLRSDLDTVFRQELVSGSCNFPGIEIPDVL
jgi:hypothetical protein